jgi:hypothetical protein
MTISFLLGHGQGPNRSMAATYKAEIFISEPGRPGAAGAGPRRASRRRWRRRSRARPGFNAVELEVGAVGEQDVDAPPVRRAEVACPWPSVVGRS